MHDRGDYMHGWQLDDAFASRGKGAQAEEEEEEEVPFAWYVPSYFAFLDLMLGMRTAITVTYCLDFLV